MNKIEVILRNNTIHHTTEQCDIFKEAKPLKTGCSTSLLMSQYFFKRLTAIKFQGGTLSQFK